MRGFFWPYFMLLVPLDPSALMLTLSLLPLVGNIRARCFLLSRTVWTWIKSCLRVVMSHLRSSKRWFASCVGTSWRSGWTPMASCASCDFQPIQSTHQETCSMSQTHHRWHREAFLLLSDASLCECLRRCAQTWIVGQESPGLRLTQSTRKDIPGTWPNLCISCSLGYIFGLFFFVPKTQQYFKRAHEVVYLFLNQC